MSIIRVDKLSYKYDKLTKTAMYALHDVSFSVEKKEIVALIGRTGSGKSTLVSILNGILLADEGTVYFDDENIYDKNYDLTKLRFRCSVLFQYPEYQLFEETCLKDICFGALKKGLSKDLAIEKALKIMKDFDIEKLKDEVPFNISGGEKRKVALAGVLIMEPEVLILDEPIAGLDPESKNELFKHLKKLNKEKDMTIIFTTHNLDDACEYADKVMILDKGNVKGIGTPSEIFSDKDLLEASGLSEPNSIKLYRRFGISDYKSCKFDDVINNIYMKEPKDKL